MVIINNKVQINDCQGQESCITKTLYLIEELVASWYILQVEIMRKVF